MANGTIAFDTLSTSGQISGTAVSVDADYLAYGSAKSWVNFNGTGTIASRDSFNTASLTDNGTGNYTQTFTFAMSNDDFSLTGGISESGVGGQSRIVLGDGKSTTTATILSYNAGSATDYMFIATTAHGDHA